MNWRRGLFRLWAVLSVCWVVGVAVIGWPEIRRDQRTLNEAQLALISFPEGRAAEAERIALERERREAECPEVLSHSVPGVGSYLDRVWCEQLIAGNIRPVEEVVQQRHLERHLELQDEWTRAVRQRNVELLYWTIFAVVPVVVVFVVGYGLLWAAAGFRSRP